MEGSTVVASGIGQRLDFFVVRCLTEAVRAVHEDFVVGATPVPVWAVSVNVVVAGTVYWAVSFVAVVGGDSALELSIVMLFVLGYFGVEKLVPFVVLIYVAQCSLMIY